jgi:hypothetical protein
MMLELDPEAIRQHVSLIHELAKPLADRGVLIVASYGEQPDEIDPKTGRPGVPLKPKVEHFRIGDVDQTARAVMRLATEQHRNVYMPLAVYRRDGLKKGAKGSEQEVIASLGLVGDYDDDDAERWETRQQIPPNYTIETSRERYQAFTFFAEPADPARAKQLAIRLKAAANCDHGTADISHVWRIPGCPNWPNARKVTAGRSPEPQLAKVVFGPLGRVEVAEIDRALPMDAPRARAKPNGHANGHDHEQSDDAVWSEAEIAQLLDNLPASVVKAIESSIAETDRSKALFNVISAMCRASMSDDEIQLVIKKHPSGIGAKYANRHDIDKEIARVRQKTAAGRKMRSKTSEHDEEVTPEQLEEEKRRISAQTKARLNRINNQYAVAAEGGKVWVIQSRPDPNYDNRLVLDRFSFADWSKLYMNEWIAEISPNGKIQNKELPGWWLRHPHRRQYLGGIVLRPALVRSFGHLPCPAAGQGQESGKGHRIPRLQGEAVPFPLHLQLDA